MNLKKIYVIVILAVFSSCVTGVTRKYFNNQKTIFCAHDPAKDVSLDRKKTFAVLSFDDSIKLYQETKLTKIIDASASANNSYKFRILSSSDIEKMIEEKKLGLRINALKTSDEASACKILSDVAGALGVDYFFIPEVLSVNDSTGYDNVILDKGDTGENYWPEFSIIMMKISAQTEVRVKMFSAASGEFIDTFASDSRIDYFYDSPEFYRDNIASIHRENSRRSRENERRRLEREAEMEENPPKTKADMVFAVLDTIVSDELSMINAKIEFKKNIYEDKTNLYRDLYEKAFLSAFSSMNASRYDGETIEGDCVNGDGVFRFLDGSVCSGTWVDSKASGECELKYSMENNMTGKYAGTFSNGYAEGFGEFISSTGDRYVGFFEEGNKNGDGVFFYNQHQPMYVSRNGDWSRIDSSPYNVSDRDRPLKIVSGSCYRVLCQNGNFLKFEALNSSKSADAEIALLKNNALVK